jgi:hypothetical protein
MGRRACLVACGAAASLDAMAHGGSIPPAIMGAFFIALGGFLACLLAPLAVGHGPILVRIAIGLGMALATFVAWYLLLLVALKSGNQVNIPEAAGYLLLAFLTFSPWIAPVVMVVRALRARHR